MISSPCKDCPKIDSPKDKCVKDCPLIQGVQDIAVGESQLLSTAVDFADDIRFTIPTHLARNHAVL